MKPIINKKAICVTDNFILGAVISSYFNKTNSYFSIFTFPNIKKKAKSRVAQSSTNRASIHSKNRINAVRPDYVIIAGLNDYQFSFFDDLPKEVIIRINNVREIDTKLKFLKKKFNGEIRCCKKEILSGLFLAKRQNKKLVIDDKFHKLNYSQKKKKHNGVVVLEMDLNINSIIAINYAFAVNFDLEIVKRINEQEVREMQRNLTKWGKTREELNYDKVCNKIESIIKEIHFDKYKYATFFTEGVPYGLALNKIIPTTYVRKRLEEYFIFDNIFNEQNNNFFHSAFIFSPESFEKEETNKVANSFHESNYIIKALLKENATVNNFGSYASHFPYDVLHICSHGGEVDGHYVVQKFKDRKGIEHQVEYYEITSFSLCDELDEKFNNRVAVDSKFIFKKMDGFIWMSKKLKAQKIPRYVWQDLEIALMKNSSTEKDIVRIPIKYEIPTSCSIQCADSIHQGQFHYLAAHTSPFIFNNSCFSWLDIASSFIGAGARGYLGTLWNIDNEIAKDSAEYFYENIFPKNKNIADVVYRINQKIKDKRYKDIYIFWGVHFSKIRKAPRIRNKGKKINKIFSHLYNLLGELLKKVITSEEEDVKRNSMRFSKFIVRIFLDDFKAKGFLQSNNFKKFMELVEQDKAIKTIETDKNKIYDRSILTIHRREQDNK